MNDVVGQVILVIVLIIIVVFVIVVVARSVRIIPQARAGVVERLGRYHKTLMPGLNILVPFIDRLRPLIDLREQVVSFPPQPVITEDNLVVSIDTVVFFQVTDARAATYEISNYLGAVEQLATTTLRNVVGGLNLEEALTSRDEINGQLRIVLDEATGKWGIRVSRVELKAIDPPASIQDSMEKQMRAERERRAVILTAEGTKQSAILEAEGHRQAEILRAEGDAKAQVLRAQGEAEAITTVFGAIHRGEPDNLLLAYQYLQTLPKIAEGSANKLWVIPSELTEALKGIGGALGGAVQPGASGRAERAAANAPTESIVSEHDVRRAEQEMRAAEQESRSATDGLGATAPDAAPPAATTLDPTTASEQHDPETGRADGPPTAG
ncbi:SPFH domain-containing protein [Herbiconiux sp. A18JL235]|uniref:SPFH domain-containing protein n=1 Tax=Herbiconiux sp. A18JL235 TaxID=3152363 RepID=A0AB39BBE1_9MICO